MNDAFHIWSMFKTPYPLWEIQDILLKSGASISITPEFKWKEAGHLEHWHFALLQQISDHKDGRWDGIKMILLSCNY